MTTKLPDHVGVYGGGRMGGGIAHAFLLHGSRVTVVESNSEAADASRNRIIATLAKAAERGSLTEPVHAVLPRLEVVTNVEPLAGCGLVIEAVPEVADLKVRILAEVEQAAPLAFLATNTSALSVNDLAAELTDPKRFIGLHFFNPVPASELVEIVVGQSTSPDLVELAHDWVAGLGKTPITVTDSPGFASSRLGVAIALEAMRMLESGVASAEDIDTAMTLGYKHPMGPLKTTDVVGLDVRLSIAEHLAAEFGERFEPPAILREKVQAGHLGRKSGEGFYQW